jgi:hypothetical protein
MSCVKHVFIQWKNSAGMGGGRLVTLAHKLKMPDGTYVRADEHKVTKDLPRVPFHGTVYNLHVYTDDEASHHFILENALVAHNVEK